MRSRLVLAAASTALLVAAPTATASAKQDRAEASKGAKGKKAKCRKGQVRVKVLGRMRCLPLSRALPKPKAVDPRLAIVKEGLTPEIGRVPDPKDRIPTPMEKVYRSFGPKALGAMEKAVGTATKRLDGLAAGRGRASGPAIASGAGNEFTQTVGNVKIDARLSIAIDATNQFVGLAQLSLTTDQGGGRSVKVTTEIPIKLDHFGFESDVCPSAAGKLLATDGIGITVRSEVRSNNGKTLDEYFVYEVADDTEMQGIVADDAKLDTLEIRSIEDVTEKAGGSIWGGSIVHGSIVRNTVVDMRTGHYEPHVSVVSVGIVLSGVLKVFTGAIRPQVAERLKKAADEGFAATVDFELKKYRELEDGWNTPNKCAKLEFGRKNRSLTLHRGEGGDETVKVNAGSGGSPASAKWSIAGQENGTFSLNSDSANPNGFKYKVTKAGETVEVKGTFKAISKAGVAEDSWIQKTEPEPSIEHIAGNFGGEVKSATSTGKPSVQRWTGVATFDRFTPAVSGGASGTYLLSSGSVSIEASGTDGTGITGCQQSGSANEMPIPPMNGSAEVTGTGPEQQPPYTYSLQAILPFTEIEITRHDCPAGAEEFEGTKAKIFPLYHFDTGPHESADGIVYLGSNKEEFGGTVIEETWNFLGA
jgi:hypothetical protein